MVTDTELDRLIQQNIDVSKQTVGIELSQREALIVTIVVASQGTMSHIAPELALLISLQQYLEIAKLARDRLMEGKY